MPSPGVAELKRVGAGREAEIFAWDEGRVLRLARSPFHGRYVERERIALKAAGRCGAPAPAVYERVDVDGRPGLVMERLSGHDMLSGMLLRPWELLLIGPVLGSLHAALHEIRAPAELPDLRADVAERLQSDLVPADVREAGLHALEHLPDGDRLYHGDLHPGNVLRRGRRFSLIDWKNAARADPAADVARTKLLLVGAWIPGLGPRLPQLVLTPFRLLLYAGYRIAYRHRRRLRDGATKAWRPVLAAARLAEDIPQERRRLLGIARRGLRGA